MASEGIELRVRGRGAADSERLLAVEEEHDDEELAFTATGAGLQGEGTANDWDFAEEEEGGGGGDLLREIDSKRKKRNVAEPYYFKTQNKVILGVLLGLGAILLILVSYTLGFRAGAPPCCGPEPEKDSVLKAELAQMGSSVLAAMNRSVDPCHDFYRYSCGTWLSTTKRPADKSSYTKSLTSIADANQLTVLSILNDEWPLISTFYSACMDNETLNRLDAAPLQRGLDAIANITNLDSLFTQLAHLHLEDVSTLFYFSSRTDLDQPNITISVLSQSGLGLPDRQFYLDSDNKSVVLREQYKDHMRNFFSLLNRTAESPDMILEVETQLAQIFIPRTDLRDPYKTNSMMNLEEVKHLAQLPWDLYFDVLRNFSGNTNLTVGKINVRTPDYFRTLAALITNNTLSVEKLKAYLTWQFVYQNANLLSSRFREEAERWSNLLYDRQAAPPRWKQCVGATQSMLGFIIGHHFVQTQFPQESKKVAQEMVGNLQKTFGKNINQLDWMDDATKQNALAKLAKISNKIGYPDKWPTYEGAQIESDKFFDSVVSLERLGSRETLREIGQPVDKSEWYMFPQEVNAYYSPQSNEIVFPAGILASPVFNRTYLNAMNYGAIGMVIGHEITHGFDDQGSKYDGDGRMAKWWSNSTLEQFNQRAQCVASYYSKYSPLPDVHVNGNLTNGENIADMGGLKAAYYAFQAAKEHEREARHITDDLIREAFGGLTNDQLFFVSFAQLWCGLTSESHLRIALASDPHSPYEYRVNGPASNSPEFASAFKCPRDAPMNPASKCSVW